jgi:hypothetical protein
MNSENRRSDKKGENNAELENGNFDLSGWLFRALDYDQCYVVFRGLF